MSTSKRRNVQKSANARPKAVGTDETTSTRQTEEAIKTLGEQVGLIGAPSAEFTQAVEALSGPIQVSDPGPVQEPVIEVGDNVYVGEPSDDKVHWVVDFIHPAAQRDHDYPAVRLVSGLSGRTREAALNGLTLHSKGSISGQA